MKQFFPYLLCLCAVCVAVFIFVQNRKNADLVQIGWIFQKKLSERESVERHDLDDFALLDDRQQETSLYGVLRERSVHAFIVTSFEACSTCREDVLRRWGEVRRKNPNAQVVVIATEGRHLDEKALRGIRSSAKAGGHGLPILIDGNGEVLHWLGLEKEKTPVEMIVNGNTRAIIRANVPRSETLELDVAFVTLFERMIL